ncbi:MAG: hypothetical protein AB7N29_19995 [Vicinamibacterales bacterium]
MQTAIHRQPTDARRFILAGLAGSLALFGFLRIPWVEAQLVLPLTLLQGEFSRILFGAPRLPVQVTLECSGADALALCVGAILAFPASLSARLAGAAGGIALILVLNTLRIGTLGLVAAEPAWFGALHLYVWPAILVLAIAAYVFGWMQLAESRGPREAERPPRANGLPLPPWQPSWQFIGLTAIFVIGFAAAAPLYYDSALILALGGLIASGAATVIATIGVSAQATANVLSTSRGAFIVTQDCISTPLLPVYLAAVVTYAPNRRWLALGLLATLPLFTLLGILRLLVVAVPATVMASPLFVVHAFYQLLLGAVAVWVAAHWRHGRRQAPLYAGAGVVVFAVVAALLSPASAWLISLADAPSLDDPQGALAFLPSFQVGLYLALWVAVALTGGWLRVFAGLGALVGMQIAGLFALHSLAAIGFTAQVRDVRAWAVAGPVLILAAVISRARTAH